MKRMFFLLTVLVLFSSCGTSYYYAQMSSNDPYMNKDDKGNFIVDADSMRITYSFHGKDAPIKVAILNKMDRDLHIDWDQSYFTFGDGDNNKVKLNDNVEWWEAMQIVGRGKEVERTLFELSNLHLDKTEEYLFKDRPVVKTNGEVVKVKTAEYIEDNTPLYIRSFIALRQGSAQADPLFFNQDFYISKISKSKDITPEEYAAHAYNYGDNFYISKKHGRGIRKFFKTTGEVLLVTGVVTISVMSTISEIKAEQE